MVYVATDPTAIERQQGPQLAFFRELGFHVTAIASPGPELWRAADSQQITARAIPIPREINPTRDLIALFRMHRVLRQIRPDIVNAGTPKAGLLGMLAARLSQVPVRIYTQRGLRLETVSGLKQRVLTLAERRACDSAHRVVCVSNSLRRQSLCRKLTTPEKAVVLANGSSSGVDAQRFGTPPQSNVLKSLRERFRLPFGAPVVGFVGRLTRDKGIAELYRAVNQLRQSHPETRLLLVGEFEAGDPVDAQTVQSLRQDARTSITGTVADASPFYHLMTVLGFPSFREGFPNAPLEAACAGVPSVAFAATGTVDAIQDEVTGALVPFGNVTLFANALKRYLDNSEIRLLHGRAAMRRATTEFAPQLIWTNLLTLYISLLRSNGMADRIPRQALAYLRDQSAAKLAA